MAILQNIKTLNKMLQEHGQATDLSAKRSVWKIKGLDRRLGRYEGTPAQVNALIRTLKNNPTISVQQPYGLPGYDVNVPNIGEVYRLNENIEPSQSSIYRRTGDTIETINLEQIGLDYLKSLGGTMVQGRPGSGYAQEYQLPTGEYVNFSSGTTRQYGLEQLSKAGIDFNSIAQQNYYDNSLLGTPIRYTGELSAFMSQPVTPETRTFIPNPEANASLPAGVASPYAPTVPKQIEQAPQVSTPTTPTTPQVLSEAQQAAYYASQSKSATPLSPADWLKQQGTTGGNEVPKNILDAATEAIKKGQQIVNETNAFLQSKGLPGTTGTGTTGTGTTLSGSSTTPISGTGGASISSIQSDAGLPKIPSQDEITQSVLNSEEFKLIQEKLGLNITSAEVTAEEAAQALEMKYGKDKKALEEKLAGYGLAFSGIRTSQVEALINELASNKLSVDRKLSLALLDANLDLKDAVMQEVADKIKDAQAGYSDAVAQLNKVGLAVIGDQLVPTLEYQREQRTAEESAERLYLAQEAAVRAQESLEISKTRLNLALQKEGQLKVTEQLRQDMSVTMQQIKGLVSQFATGTAQGDEGYYNPMDYEVMEEVWATNFPDKMGVFYSLFPVRSYINPIRHPDFIKIRETSFDLMDTMIQSALGGGVNP